MLRRSLLQAIVLLPLIGALPACKSSDAPAPPAPAPDLQIVSAGNEPRQLLRYHPAIGTKQKLQVTIDVELEAGEMGGPMPTLQITMTLSVDAILPTGLMRVHATIDDVTARDHPDSKVPAVALTGPVELLRGLAIHALLSPGGRLSGSSVDRTSKVLPPEVDSQVASLVDSFEQTMMPLPDEPVGVGAVWRNSRSVEHNGMKLKAVNSVSVTAIAGNTITYTIDTDIHGEDQVVKQGDMAIEVKDIVGNGGGKGTLDLVTLAVTSEMIAEFRSEMMTTGDAEPTKMSMATMSKVRPL